FRDGADLALLGCEHAGLKLDHLPRIDQGLFGAPSPLGLKLDAWNEPPPDHACPSSGHGCKQKASSDQAVLGRDQARDTHAAISPPHAVNIASSSASSCRSAGR